ncbi:collagen-like triple helix repeat-containing protein [Sphingobacterium hungaricum]|uniref:Collagen triple helix repeat-containing protein n=1 Tax=Sphingobacterium hungaricum TaxID=2082723 RepID=A0A928YRZ1_9SPHI|nr:collagen-like protein [Sphingobacterium hungaricum]MBE8715197.1 hypothetical protein [Sphingobacterium hungaricum]
MKAQRILIYIAIVAIYLTSCKKGDQGPQGLQGDKGAQGERGLAGANGDDGSIIYSGTAVPTASIGKNGDYYFRTSTSLLYGPKTSDGWGTGVSLRGATGNAGASGSKILSGNVVPATTIGAVGDFYFQTNNYLFYGPKTAAGWGTAVNLRGATGTANVIYSGWQLARNFRDSTIDGTLQRVGHIYAPRVTATTMNSSVVLMYLNFGGGTFQLPYTSFAAGKASTIAYHLKNQEIVVQRFTHDGSNSISLSTGISYRYVIVPGAVVAKMKAKQIDLNNMGLVEQELSKFE